MYLEQSEQSGEREGAGAGRGQELVVQGLVGHREGPGFLPEGCGSPAGLWAEERQDLTRVLTGALWLLQGEQTVAANREGVGGGTEWEAGMSECQLLFPPGDKQGPTA